MQQYLDLLRYVLKHGVVKDTRPKLASTKQHVKATSVFAPPIQLRFDLSAGFPLVTTKRIPFKQVVHELAWFLSGSTNVKPLQEKGVKIWNEWADEDGNLGPVYGKQWRHWQGATCSVDQIAAIVRDIKRVKEEPNASCGRRLILTAWNPAEVHLMKGPPACHTLAQFDVTAGRLSCHLYQRSADLFLGVPWNIACYALLTHLLARATSLEVGWFMHTFGDAHIYENHFVQVHEQLGREPYPLGALRLDPSVATVDGLNADLVSVENYQHHPALHGEVAI